MQDTITLQKEPRPERIDIGNGMWENIGQRVSEDGAPDKNTYVDSAIRRLMSGKHVVMSEYDIALVEDTTLHVQPGKNPIVAAICMQQMAGYYGSVEVTYGALGAVGTLLEYRNRGLIRRLFLEMIHPVADARGDLMTFIIGIPHFYRLFGYEYAVPHKFGQPLKDPISTLFPLLKDASERFTLREVAPSDLPYLVQMTTPKRLHCNAQLGIYYGKAFWDFIAQALAPEAIERHHDAHHHAGIIVDTRTGKDIGVSLTSYATRRWIWEAFSIDLDEATGITYKDVMPSILRQLKAFDRPYYECYNAKLNDNILPAETETEKRDNGFFSPRMYSELVINLTKHHPVTKLLDSQGRLAPENPPLRLYTRIHSLPKWIEKIAPVLEQRLKDSAMLGISARIQLNFFRKMEGMSGRGLEIVFRRGKFVRASDWEDFRSLEQIFREQRSSASASKEKEDEAIFRAGFAPLTFTRLVTGAMDVSELLQRDGENFVENGETKMLLEILFPKLDHFVDLFWW
ncbi:hypothetical protein BGZ54_003857 [Gamsiella multidivaricata]|nr:hypothetical protein BGZ54_003857 [Gamsiella multidivaricata]